MAKKKPTQEQIEQNHFNDTVLELFQKQGEQLEAIAQRVTREARAKDSTYCADNGTGTSLLGRFSECFATKDEMRQFGEDLVAKLDKNMDDRFNLWFGRGDNNQARFNARIMRWQGRFLNKLWRVFKRYFWHVFIAKLTISALTILAHKIGLIELDILLWAYEFVKSTK